MKRLFILASLAFAAPAFAQQAPATPEKTFTITIGERELNYVGSLLQAQPYRDAQPIIDDLRRQIAEQNKAAEPAKK
jgi:hypothetical protein